MKPSNRGPRSILASEIDQFLAYKRSLRRRYDAEEKTLALFDDFLAMHGVADLAMLTPTLIDQFLNSRPRARPRSYNHLRGTLARLFAWMVGHGRLAATPVQSPPRRSRYQRTPFIFDVANARRLLVAAKLSRIKGAAWRVARHTTFFSRSFTV